MLRRTWNRPDRARLVLAMLLAVAAGAVTAGLVGRANELAGRYGEHQTFAIARRDLAPGDTVSDADLAWRSVPTALVGGSRVDDVIGRTVVAPILGGEPVVAERLAPDGLGGPMALAPPGTRAVAIPATDARPPVVVGDHVDVFAVALDGTSRTQRVASSAVVVAVSDDATTVAVEAGEVAPTARAALEQTAVIALVAPTDGPDG